ncbi:7298_t:CDS:2 [Cetraspora pellucida]|uniref:7298_t:CDS:1 n=1 Tax=Cetraspora pellucida TaxID=1433469 RepID=A0A9N9FLB7_9GLOM|nr:7298_t:CDS:2 [Cetraspora pellucida]
MSWYSHSKYDYLSDKNLEYNSNFGDDLPNLTIDKQQIFELEKFALYPDSLDRIKISLGQKSFDGFITNTYFHSWQKSTEVIRKKDKIYLYIKNALQIAIKEITGLNLSKDNLFVADFSNESKWKLLPEKMHPFIDEKVNKDLHCFQLVKVIKPKTLHALSVFVQIILGESYLSLILKKIPQNSGYMNEKKKRKN